MKVLLAYPPDRCLPTIPYSSLAQLSAVLKHAGHECVIRDVNAETFAWLNHRERLAGYFDFAVSRIAELEAKPVLSEQERGIYRFLAPLVAAPRETILFAPEAAAIRTRITPPPASGREAARLSRAWGSRRTSPRRSIPRMICEAVFASVPVAASRSVSGPTRTGRSWSARQTWRCSWP
jgi:hypothetical protein